MGLTLDLQLDMNTFIRHLQLSTLDNGDLLVGFAAAWVHRDLLDLIHNVKAFEDLSKDDMLSIKPTTTY